MEMEMYQPTKVFSQKVKACLIFKAVCFFLFIWRRPFFGWHPIKQMVYGNGKVRWFGWSCELVCGPSLYIFHFQQIAHHKSIEEMEKNRENANKNIYLIFLCNYLWNRWLGKLILSGLFFIYFGDDYSVMNYFYRMSKSIILWKFLFRGKSRRKKKWR